MPPTSRWPRGAFLGLAVLDGIALAMLLASRALGAGSVALAVHLGLAAGAWYLLPAGSRRLLAVAWMTALPGVGALVAFAGFALEGAGELGRSAARARRARPTTSGRMARRIATRPPLAECLVSGLAEERRAALDVLVTRADAEAVALLRWSLRQGDGDLALEAALTLEEMTATSEADRAGARARFEHEPSFEAAVTAGDLTLGAIESGLVGPEMVAALSSEARAYYGTAASLDVARAGELLERRARLELAARRPSAALELLAPAIATHAADERVGALYRDAAAAARGVGVALGSEGASHA